MKSQWSPNEVPIPAGDLPQNMRNIGHMRGWELFRVVDTGDGRVPRHSPAMEKVFTEILGS